LEFAIQLNYERVPATKHTPHHPRRLIKCIYGLAEIIERGGGVLVERLRINAPHRCTPPRSIFHVGDELGAYVSVVGA
jgi:hypothetical protein